MSCDCLFGAVMSQLGCLHSSLSGRQLVCRTERQPAVQRHTLQIVSKDSRIGKAPVTVPKGVTVTLKECYIHVKGPKGELQQTYPPLVDIYQEEDKLLVRKREFKDKSKQRKAYATHGLVRSLANGMVIGTSEGFTKELSLIGVGYRGAVSGQKLTMNLGYSHPVEMDIPQGITVQVAKSTQVTISGFDKCAVGDFAAAIRAWRPPEPYKGKGIRFVGEVVRKKEGKRGK